MKKYKQSIWTICLWAFCITLFGQSREELEKERTRIIEQIEQTTKNLEATKSNKNATLQDLKAIEAQIKSRKQLIGNIQQQIKAADESIRINDTKIDSLNNDLSQLDGQFRELSRNMYLRELASNKWAYVLSASSVNDAFLRWRYSKQYEAFTKQKTDQFTTLMGNISNRNNSILEEKKYIQVLLSDEQKSYNQLEKDLKKKDEILAKLQKEESALREELSKKKQQREKLNQEIEKIIIAELSKAKKKSNASADNTSSLAKNSLEWPVKGYISSKFGNQRHPTLKNVTISNNGIDITGGASAPVSVVADGTVIGVSTIPGYDYMVIVQHGAYYSVYSKLNAVNVRKNQTIKAGSIIGTLGKDAASELHFEFWNGKNKLNPEQWLK